MTSNKGTSVSTRAGDGRFSMDEEWKISFFFVEGMDRLEKMRRKLELTDLLLCLQMLQATRSREIEQFAVISQKRHVEMIWHSFE